MYVSIVSPRLSRPVLDRPTRAVDRGTPSHFARCTDCTHRSAACGPALLLGDRCIASFHISHMEDQGRKKEGEKKLYKSQQGPHPHFRVWPCRAIFSLPIASHQIFCPIARLLAQLDKDPPQESPRFLHTFISRYLYIVTSHPPLLHTHAHAHTHTREHSLTCGPPRQTLYIQPSHQHGRQGTYRARQPLLLDLL